ncbi:MAG: nuclear transport factor 2 family protein [Vulcanimicrobiaceae bacterium]
MSTQTVPTLHVAERFVGALARKDFAELERCFAPNVMFRALVPTGYNEASNARDARRFFEHWFGDVESMQLRSARLGQMGSRTLVGYGIAGYEDGMAFSCEQTLYCDIIGNQLAHVNLLCSGFIADA